MRSYTLFLELVKRSDRFENLVNATAEEVKEYYNNELHPYDKALLKSVPMLERESAELGIKTILGCDRLVSSVVSSGYDSVNDLIVGAMSTVFNSGLFFVSIDDMELFVKKFYRQWGDLDTEDLVSGLKELVLKDNRSERAAYLLWYFLVVANQYLGVIGDIVSLKEAYEMLERSYE